jgi:hypothetical protein
MAREATPSAFAKLIELTRSRNAAVALRACELVVSWGVGRPAQSVDVTARRGADAAAFGELGAAATSALARALAEAEAVETASATDGQSVALPPKAKSLPALAGETPEDGPSVVPPGADGGSGQGSAP